MCNVLNEKIMTYGMSEVLSKDSSVQMMHLKQQSVHHQQQQQQNVRKSVGVMGSRRIFAPSFKLKVLHSYRYDMDCRGNQRATARKYGIHRRQIQKWLQCEENLRNSCAESGNNTSISTTTTTTTTTTMTDSSASVSKSDDFVTEAAEPAATPAAPALNLNVARLHGDELITQQRPPPLLSPHLPRGSAPSSPQYSLQTTSTSTVLPLRLASVGHQEYPSPTEECAHRETEDMIHVQENHSYRDTQVDQERDYYVSNGDDAMRDGEMTSAAFNGRNEVKVYQNMTSYHSPHQEYRYGASDIDMNTHHYTPSRCHSYGETDSADGKQYVCLIRMPLTETEPASPDSAATSGPYEPAGSPGGPWAPLSPTVSHRVANNSSGSPSSVHFNSPPGPPVTDLYVQLHVPAHWLEHTDSCPSLVRKTPYRSRLHQQERESKETTGHVEEKGELKEKTEYCKTVIKEEVDIPEEEMYEERPEDNASPYIDVTGGPSIDESGPLSSGQDRDGYSFESLPSSPRDSANSGRSSSSWSDSEMDSLDCAPGSQNSSGNLARRRSFPLRFKLSVLDAFYWDAEIAGNQRATARKFGINRRQVQKWLGQEKELRGEIVLRGNLRQRLGPIQDVSSESPMDLSTMNVSSDYSQLSRDPVFFDTEHRQSSPGLHCCNVSSVSPQHRPYYQLATDTEPSSEIEPTGSCNFSCCTDRQTTTSTTSSYQDLSLRGSYTESPNRIHCFSPRDYSEFFNLPEGCDQTSSLKRQHCMLSCCYEAMPSPKKFCLDGSPPQDAPLCLVKPKKAWEASVSPSRMELVTGTIPTSSESVAPQPSPSTSNKDDGILFKPYLDNPVCKPANEDIIQRGLSPLTRENINNNNNNNDNNISNNNNYCQTICNTNEDQNHNRNLQLNLQLPISWMPYPGPYTESQRVGSTFIRYPAHSESTCFLFNPLRPEQIRTTENRKFIEEEINRVIRDHAFRLQDTRV